MPNVYIPKEYEQKRTLVAVPKKEYEEFVAARHNQGVTVPKAKYREFLAYLKERDEVLEIVRRGEAEYRAGKTRTVQSLAELMN